MTARTARREANYAAPLASLTDADAADIMRHAAALAALTADSDTDRDDAAQSIALAAMHAVASGATTDRREAVRTAAHDHKRDRRADAADRADETASGLTEDYADAAAESLWMPRDIAPDSIARTTVDDRRRDALALVPVALLPLLGAAQHAAREGIGYADADGIPTAAAVASVMGLKRGRASQRVAAALALAVDETRAAAWATASQHRAAWDGPILSRTARPLSGRPVTTAAAPTHRSAVGPVAVALDAAHKRAHGGACRPVASRATASPVVTFRPSTGQHTVTLADRSLILTAAQAATVLALTDAQAPYAATDADRDADAWALALAPTGAVVKSSNRKRKGGGRVGTSVQSTRTRRAWGDTSAPAARLA